MGSPTHSYCSLKDLLKNQPSPKPKFKNHSYLRSKPELEDVYTNLSLDASILESLSPSRKPSFQIANEGHKNGKMCAIEKPQIVESPTIGCNFNSEKGKQRCVEEKINVDPQVDMFASDDEDEKLKADFFNGEKEDAEETEMDKNEVVESNEQMEEKEVVKPEEEIEEHGEVELEKQTGEGKEVIKVVE